MNQTEINQSVGKKINELSTAQMGELIMETIRLRSANSVLSDMLDSAQREIQALKNSKSADKDLVMRKMTDEADPGPDVASE